MTAKSLETHGFTGVEDWIATALKALEPAARAELFRGLAQELRRRGQARMTKQVDPDGQSWRPRKRRSGVRDGAGQIRRAAKMFRGLRKARRLKISSGPDGLKVGWRGGHAILAAAHHHGGVAGDRTPVPARPLIGLSAGDVALIRAKLLELLAQ